MVGLSREFRQSLSDVAEDALRSSAMDVVGLYVFDGDDRMHGVIHGLPRAFHDAYESQGIAIDPVLARVRKTGAPSSTLLALGDRWQSCQLYLRISGRFGLKGFATLPLYQEDRLSGVLYLGATADANVRRLDAEGLCVMSPHATRASVRILKLPVRHPRLTPRQNEVAALAARGLTNREIAEELGTGAAAVHKHMKELNRRFKTSTRTAMAAAWRDGCARRRDGGSPFED